MPDGMESQEVIGLGVDLFGVFEATFDVAKALNDWMTQTPAAPDPMMHSLGKVHAALSEIEDQALAIWVTEREDNLSFLLAHSASALQTANAFLQSGAPRSDPEWIPRLANAERDSFVAVQTFTGELEGGFWLRPDSVKAISWAGDPTSFNSGWMPYIPDRAEHHSFNRVWDHRWGLPAAIYSITARLVVLQTAGADTAALRQEVERYNSFIARVFQKMESGIRALEALSDKQINNIPTHGVPMAVADIYGGLYIGGLWDPMSMSNGNFPNVPSPPGITIPTGGHLDIILDNKDKLTNHWRNHIAITIGLPKLLEFAGRLENLLARLATTSDTLLALRNVGIDFSVPEADLREWLNNASFTPYPALAEALLTLLKGKRLRQPVFLDVIAFNYENTPGAVSPRSVADVDVSILMAAVIQSHNERYSEDAADFQSLVQ